MATIRYHQVTKRFDGGVVAVDDLTLDVEEGEFLILVGPSGCGKTTALRMTSGLEEVTSGEIRIGGEIVNDIPPVERDIAMVFQNYALYPHMTVYENIAFPLRQRRVKRREIRARVDEAARLLAIDPLLDRRPRELSGGQRQRVAIGRALVRRPQAFLMDEPLSNLDAKLRVQMRAELLSLHDRLGITTVYVTHDQTEAMTLGDRVVVLDHGVVQQVDAPERLYRDPSNVFVAGFIGSPSMNFLAGVVDGNGLLLGSRRVELDGDVADRLGGKQGEVIVGLRPEDLRLADGDGIDAEVVIVEQLGPEVLAYLRSEEVRALPTGPGAVAENESPDDLREMLVTRLPGNARIAPRQRLRVAPDPRAIRLFDPRTGQSLLG